MKLPDITDNIIGIGIVVSLMFCLTIALTGLYNYFTMTPEERNRKFGLEYRELCIEGIKYIKGFNSKSSFTVLVDKEGKPLVCDKELIR
jgi:hypothetical protein